jgi:hypothetical protein
MNWFRRGVLVLGLLCFIGAEGCRRSHQEPPPPRWSYQGELHKAIERADCIVVRDGGFDGPRPIDEQKVLFRITKPGEVRLVAENLRFETEQNRAPCHCIGYPGVDWFQGQQRIAATSVQHCRAMRWKGFPSDGVLTPESGAWLKQWLISHGVKEDAIR